MDDEKMVSIIKEDLKSMLTSEFGYCGIMESKNVIMLNSGKGNIVINIKWESKE